MMFQTSDETELYYEAYGQKEDVPILLVHGLGANSQMWAPQIDTYPERGLYLIIPDMRGHGKSSKLESFKITDCVRDLSELLDHLGVIKASVVGVSMGGLIAQQLALDYPEKVDKLVIVDSFSGVEGFAMKFNAKLASLLLRVMPKRLLANLYGTAYKGEENWPVRKYFHDVTMAAEMKHVRLARSEVNRFNVIDRLGEIKNPTLVLVGDLFGKMAVNMAKKTAEGIEDAGFKILEGGADPSNMLVPENFDQEVLGFILSEVNK